jgi:hypothetical protein
MSYRCQGARAVACLVACVALGPAVSAAQPRAAGAGTITVSDDVNFEGVAVTFRNDVADLRAYQFNDRISSIQIAPGDSWEVCTDTNFGGRCVVISTVERDLRPLGMNDAVSSLRRVPARTTGRGGFDRGQGGGITVSDDVNFEGATLTLRRDIRDLREVQFNDRISSLQLSPDESWEACEHADYGGRCLVFSRAERDLRPFGLNDAITSLRRVANRERGGVDRRGGLETPRTLTPSEPRGEIVLFDRPGYRGAARSVKEPADGLGSFTNRARSAQILHGAWELCDQPRWAGRCVRFANSMPDLDQVGLRGIASARPIDRRRER